MEKFTYNFKKIIAIMAISSSISLTGCTKEIKKLETNIEIMKDEINSLKKDLESQTKELNDKNNQLVIELEELKRKDEALSTKTQKLEESLKEDEKEETKEEKQLENNITSFIDLINYFKSNDSLQVYSFVVDDLLVDSDDTHIRVGIRVTNENKETLIKNFVFDKQELIDNKKELISLINKKASNISYLELSFIDLSDEELQKIEFANMPNLNALVLGHNKISDISYLNSLANVEVIDLSYNKISDASMLDFNMLNKVWALDLSNNEISDAKLVPSIKSLGHRFDDSVRYILSENEFDSSQYEVLCEKYHRGGTNIRYIYFDYEYSMYPYDINSTDEIATYVINSCIEKEKVKTY